MSLPTFIWEVIAVVISRAGIPYSAEDFQADTWKSMHISLGYLDRNAFLKVRQWPFKLTQGDVKERIHELQVADPAKLDFTSTRIRECAIAFPRDTLHAATLLKDTSATIQLVEETHRCGKILKNFH